MSAAVSKGWRRQRGTTAAWRGAAQGNPSGISTQSNESFLAWHTAGEAALDASRRAAGLDAQHPTLPRRRSSCNRYFLARTQADS